MAEIAPQEKIDLLLKAVKKGQKEIKRLIRVNYIKREEEDIARIRVFEINELVKKAGEKI